MDKYRYKILEEIGKGSFGKVFKARKVKSKSRGDYAIKKVRCDAPENVELALQEFWTLSCLQAHNNIIRFEECYLQHGDEIRPMHHGDTSSPAYMYLVEMAIKGKRGWDQAQYYLWFVMEYCNSGDMNDYILDRDPTAYLNTIFMLQLADGIAFLHKSNVVHRDLKPENVLVRTYRGRDPVLKIADFGLSKVCNHPIKGSDVGKEEDEIDVNVDTCWLSSACGSDFFMAPEVFEGRYTAKADVFALGIIFWAIMDRITFIDAGTKKVLLGTYVRRDKEVLPVGEALLVDPNLDMSQLLVDTGHGSGSSQRCKRSETRSCVLGSKKKLRTLIAQMVHPNPEFRPSSQELLGRLNSVLQAERPKNLNLSVKKQKVVKDEVLVPKSSKENHSSVANVAPVQKVRRKFIKKGGKIEKDETCKPEVVPDNIIVENDSNVPTNEAGRKFDGSKNKSSRKLSAKNDSNNEDATIGKLVKNRRKAKDKALSAMRKKVERVEKRVLRSASAKLVKNVEPAPSEEEPAEIVDDLKTDEGQIQIKKEYEESEKEVILSEGQKDDFVPDDSVMANDSEPDRVVRLKDFVLLKNEELCMAATDVRTLQHDSDEGGEFLGETDGDSRDSIISEVPEFDSGYKSKKSRRITSHVSQTETTECSEDVNREYTPSPILTSQRKNDAQSTMNLFPRRHIGLKQQIIACKSNSDLPENTSAKETIEIPSKNSVESFSRKSVIEKTPVAPKPKLEVPKTPLVVLQSKAKFHHNPHHTAVKKRWKYFVLDEPETFPTDDKTSNATQQQATSLLSVEQIKKSVVVGPHQKSRVENAHSSQKLQDVSTYTTHSRNLTSSSNPLLSLQSQIDLNVMQPARKNFPAYTSSFKRNDIRANWKERNSLMPPSGKTHNDAALERILPGSNSLMPPSGKMHQINTAFERKLPGRSSLMPPKGKTYQNDAALERTLPGRSSLMPPSGKTHQNNTSLERTLPGHSPKLTRSIFNPSNFKDPTKSPAFQKSAKVLGSTSKQRTPDWTRPIVQQLSSYWNPKKRSVVNSSKIHTGNSGTKLVSTRTPDVSNFFKPYRKHRKRCHEKLQPTSSKNMVIETIDLTIDDDDDFKPKRSRNELPCVPALPKTHQTPEREIAHNVRHSSSCKCYSCFKTRLDNYGENAPRSFRRYVRSPSYSRDHSVVNSPINNAVSPEVQSSMKNLTRTTSAGTLQHPVLSGYTQLSHGLFSSPHRDTNSASAMSHTTPYAGMHRDLMYSQQQHVTPLKMPELLYCGSSELVRPQTSPELSFKRSPPSLIRVHDHSQIARQLVHNIPQSQFQSSSYQSPPRLRRAPAVPDVDLRQYPSGILPSTSLSLTHGETSHKVHAFQRYPYQTRHPKPILNK